jgi:hypothetical protein
MSVMVVQPPPYSGASQVRQDLDLFRGERDGQRRDHLLHAAAIVKETMRRRSSSLTCSVRPTRPERVLSCTAGKLVADAYKGYDKITLPGGLERAMAFILELYKVERPALDADLLGTPPSLAISG